MEKILRMQEDVHRVKKQIEVMFEKIDLKAGGYSSQDAFADKAMAVALIEKLTSAMYESELAHLTSTRREDESPLAIEQLKQEISKLENERERIHRQAKASLKGVM